MRQAFPFAVLLTGLLAGAPLPVLAQGSAAKPAAAPKAAAGAAAPTTAPDPILARVDGNPIRLSDVQAAAEDLPPQLRNAPTSQIFPLLLDRLISGQALTDAARKANMEKTPEVAAAIRRATDQVLQQAYLTKEVGASITDDALRARYEKEIASKPAEEEVHARHILVATKEQAEDIIAQLKTGANFNELAQKYSTDPSGKTNGGDLGFFKKGDMVPEFANAAFAMKDGEISQTPVKSPFGWHVIKVEGHRDAPKPTFEEARDQLRQEMLQEEVTKVVQQVRTAAKVVRYNPDGTPAADPTAGGSPAAPAAPKKN